MSSYISEGVAKRATRLASSYCHTVSTASCCKDLCLLQLHAEDPAGQTPQTT
jgi:hypothetical protein